MVFASTVGSVLEREFVIILYVHAVQDTHKLTETVTQVKYFELMMIFIILEVHFQHTS